jgi:hypothetical protein
MLIGEKYRSKLVWVQVHETSQLMKEDKLRIILRDVKNHVLKKRITSGSARKFKDGKLLFYEILGNERENKPSKIYCLYTIEQKIGAVIKRSIKSIADRGGWYTVYSAQRFFSEMLDLVNDPKILDAKLELTEEEVVGRIENYYTEAYDVNELGQIISFLTRSERLDWDTLEKIYLHVYESIQSLLDGSIQTDSDEFLDAAYIVARGYEEIGNYPLGLELLKYITIVAAMNQRFDLETSCKIRIGVIYKEYFPPVGEYIIEILSTVAELHLLELAKPEKEIYYCLLGYANALENDHNKATEFYQNAIEEAGVNISSALWIAEAYNYLGERAQNNYYFVAASRLYLTAASIAFSEGDVTKADTYRDNAAGSEIAASEINVKSALGLRMENNSNEAEYKAWISIRNLIKSYLHATSQTQLYFNVQALSILQEAELVLSIPGKARKNRAVITKIRKFVNDIEAQSITSDRLEKRLDELEKLVELNISIPPPTFMLLTLDGQLALMGQIDKFEWHESEIKGVILGGILVAIMSLITEVTGQTSLRTVDAGNFKIMIERSDNAIVALLLDRDIPEFRDRLQTILGFVERLYSKQLQVWRGDKKIFNPLKSRIVKILSKAYE